MPELPTGTVTFLLTDIEGSMPLGERDPDAMSRATMRYQQIGDAIVAQYEGVVNKRQGEGDSLFTIFTSATNALAAACALQKAFHAEPWPTPTPIRVRIGVHTGVAEQRDGDYYGTEVNRCARLRGLAHGGQTLVSQATYGLTRHSLSPSARLEDRGQHELRGSSQPEQVYQLCHPDLPDGPPIKSPGVPPNNLPHRLSSFIGRERECAEVERLLAKSSLLTLTGTGGSGKTRLALRVAEEVAYAYPDGVWWVSLEEIPKSEGADPQRLAQTAAAALGLREDNRPLTETLTDYLRQKTALLVLDNCEHLITACAHFLNPLRSACRNLRVLATSRTALDIAGEQTYDVPTLPVPPLNALPPLEALLRYESVDLFVTRAQAVQSDFALVQQNAPAVAEICARLDGIPLALEFAAARVRSLSAEQIVARPDRLFALLRGNDPTIVQRQQTLDATLTWSHDLLSPSEQTLLRRLSVFTGGCTLEAAERVGSGDGIEEWEILDLLDQLVRTSWIKTEAHEPEIRYLLLETVRAYGLKHLSECGEEEALRGRHLDYFLELAEAAEPNLIGPQQKAFLEQLTREHDNLRAAQKWCMESRTRLRLAGALWRFWMMRGHLSEGRSWLSNGLASRGNAPDDLRAKALNGLGYLALQQGDYAESRRCLEESVALYRNVGEPRSVAERGEADALHNLGLLEQTLSHFDTAHGHYMQSLAIRERLGDRWRIAASRNSLAMLAGAQDDFEAARSHFEACLSIFQEIGDAIQICALSSNLAAVAFQQDDYETARRLFKDVIARQRALKHQAGLAFSLHNLGEVEFIVDDLAEARSHLKESLRLQQELGDKDGIAFALRSLAKIALKEKDFDRAARLFSAEETLREAIGTQVAPTYMQEYEKQIVDLRAGMTPETFTAAWSQGKAMPLDIAVSFALE